MGARRGGETDQQNVIMHKTYWHKLSILYEKIKTSAQLSGTAK